MLLLSSFLQEIHPQQKVTNLCICPCSKDYHTGSHHSYHLRTGDITSKTNWYRQLRSSFKHIDTSTNPYQSECQVQHGYGDSVLKM